MHEANARLLGILGVVEVYLLPINKNFTLRSAQHAAEGRDPLSA